MSAIVFDETKKKKNDGEFCLFGKEKGREYTNNVPRFHEVSLAVYLLCEFQSCGLVKNRKRTFLPLFYPVFRFDFYF